MDVIPDVRIKSNNKKVLVAKVEKVAKAWEADEDDALGVSVSVNVEWFGVFVQFPLIKEELAFSQDQLLCCLFGTRGRS